MADYKKIKDLNVRDHGEGYPVELIVDPFSDRLCVVATNEGGFNSTWVDAEELYKELKEYFEGDNYGKNL